MFHWPRTVIYQVSDLDKAKEWYSSILNMEPYFHESYYVGFDVCGYELWLQSEKPTKKGPENVVAYWGVSNIEKSLDHLLSHGAVKNTDVQDVGGGIKVATVCDPFGNIFGVIENPNFKTII